MAGRGRIAVEITNYHVELVTLFLCRTGSCVYRQHLANRPFDLAATVEIAVLLLFLRNKAGQ